MEFIGYIIIIVGCTYSDQNSIYPWIQMTKDAWYDVHWLVEFAPMELSKGRDMT